MSNRSELAALKKLDSEKFREVPEAMVTILAAKGLCTAMGNITEAGRKALPWKRTSFARSAQLHRMSMSAK